FTRNLILSLARLCELIIPTSGRGRARKAPFLHISPDHGILRQISSCGGGGIQRGTVPIATGTTAYLVVRREDGFGDVFHLDPAQSYTLGRATTNAIVLKDDLCSRDHAEVSFSAGRWRARDLSSLNGTRVNGTRIENERPLSPRDEI